MKKVLLLLALTLWGCVPAAPKTAPLPHILMKRGAVAPNFKLLDINGASRSLTDFRGQVVLLNFWASWCKICVHELGAFQTLQQALSAKGFTVLAVSVDEEIGAPKRLANEKELSFPVLLDNKGKAKSIYHVSGLPVSFLIDRQGQLVYVTDARNLKPAVAIDGPRNWNESQLLAQLSSLLAD